MSFQQLRNILHFLEGTSGASSVLEFGSSDFTGMDLDLQSLSFSGDLARILVLKIPKCLLQKKIGVLSGGPG